MSTAMDTQVLMDDDVVLNSGSLFFIVFDMRVAVFTTRDHDVDGMVGFTAVIIQILSVWATTGGLQRARRGIHKCLWTATHFGGRSPF